VRNERRAGGALGSPVGRDGAADIGDALLLAADPVCRA
jgi:hypothetical protein